MINIVSVGPPNLGTHDLRSADADHRDDKTGTFARTLEKSLGKTIDKKSVDRGPEKEPEKTSEKSGADERSDSNIPLGENRVSESQQKSLERRRPSDKADGEIKDATPKLEISTKKSQLAREKEIQKFMDSFESEFGIPPTRLVEAMAQLKNSDLKKSKGHPTKTHPYGDAKVIDRVPLPSFSKFEIIIFILSKLAFAC